MERNLRMNPYYRGFTGTIVKETNYSYTTRGKYSIRKQTYH